MTTPLPPTMTKRPRGRPPKQKVEYSDSEEEEEVPQEATKASSKKEAPLPPPPTPTITPPPDTLTRKDVEVVLDTIKSQLDLINQSNKAYYDELKQEVFKNNLQNRTEQAKRQVASYFRL